MTIQEAIKSGKPFRRPSIGLEGIAELWFAVDGDRVIIYTDDGTQACPTADDILADDWELKE